MRRNHVRTISEPVVKHVIAGLDAVALLGAGVAAMHWNALEADWPLPVRFVLSERLRPSTSPPSPAAYPPEAFVPTPASGRARPAGLGPSAGFSSATRLSDPVRPADGRW